MSKNGLNRGECCLRIVSEKKYISFVRAYIVAIDIRQFPEQSDQFVFEAYDAVKVREGFAAELKHELVLHRTAMRPN